MCFCCGCQLYCLEGDGGHLRLAGDWLKLNLAEDSWELTDLLDEGLTSKGTLLKGARQHGWVGDTGELNRLLLDGKWLGKAGLDHLLGDAQLGGLLLNNVGHTDWPVEDGDPLSKDGDWGWDNGLTSALGRLSLELSLEGGWDARATLKAGSGARLVDEVGESSKVWPHNAHTWGLEVSRAFTVHVTAKADSAGLQQLWGNNLNHDSVGQDSDALLWDVDGDNTILEHHDHGGNLALDGLLDNLANNWVDLLTVDKNLEGRALWDNLGLSDAGEDLDHLLLARDSLGGDGNWNVLGAVHEENVLAVVDLVGEGHVVEGADNRWLNTAGSWDMVASQLKGGDLNWGGEDGGWEDGQWAEDSHQTEVLQDNLPGWSHDLGNLDQLGGALSTSLNLVDTLGTSDHLLRLKVSNKEGLGDTINEGQKGRRLDLGLEGPWNLDGDDNLVNRGSLVADNRGDWGKHLVAGLQEHSLLVLWRLTDLPLQLLGLLELSSELDGVHVSRLAEGKLALDGSSQWLLKDLLNGPPVLQDWAGKGALQGDAIGLTLDWGNLNSGQNGSLRLLASNNHGVDLLDLGARGALDHTSNLDNVGLLQLGKDRLDLWVLRADLGLGDLLLGERVDHSLGGQTDDQVELLSLRSRWMQLDPDRGHLHGGWEDGGWDNSEWRVLDNLGDVGVQVGELVLGLVHELTGKTKGLWDLKGHWLPHKTVGDLPHLGGGGDWNDLDEVLLEGEWHDSGVKSGDLTARPLNLLWGPDGELNLTTRHLGLNLDWGGSVQGHVNTRTNDLTSEWRDNAIDDVHLTRDDWHNLSSDRWGLVAHDLGHLEGALDRVDNWDGVGGEDWETSLSWHQGGGLIELGGTNMGELNVVSGAGDLSELLGELLKRLEDNLGVQVQGRLNASPDTVHEGEWSGKLPSLQLQLLSDLLKLGLNGWGGELLRREEVEVLLQKEVHAVGVGGELNDWELHGVGWAVVDSLHGDLVWDERLLGVDKLVPDVDQGPEVLNEGREVDIVGVLKAKLLALDEWKDRPGLKTNGLQLWDLGKSQRPEGGDNEGGDLLRWLHPGTDGQLLELSSGWLGEWKD